MPVFAAIAAFKDRLERSRTLADVRAVLHEATRRFGFEHFFLTQRFAAADTRPIELSDLDGAAPTGEFAPGWQAPLSAACEQTAAPFAWDDPPTSTVRHSGLTVPLHLPGAVAYCSFVRAVDAPLQREATPALHHIAAYAFEAARRVTGQIANRIKLTRRQLDCVALIARGKSDWVAGQILGLSADTVHKYVEAAKRRYDVSSRAELIVRALFDGHLSFAEVLAPGMPAPVPRRAPAAAPLPYSAA